MVLSGCPLLSHWSLLRVCPSLVLECTFSLVRDESFPLSCSYVVFGLLLRALFPLCESFVRLSSSAFRSFLSLFAFTLILGDERNVFLSLRALYSVYCFL